MTIQRNPVLLTAVGMMIIGSMEVFIPSVAETSDPAKIAVKDFMFNPTPLTVKAGATVTWTNMDDEPHTVVSDTMELSTPLRPRGLPWPAPRGL